MICTFITYRVCTLCIYGRIDVKRRSQQATASAADPNGVWPRDPIDAQGLPLGCLAESAVDSGLTNRCNRSILTQT
ncbi:hypothetical protein BCR44DRAFT_1432804, partial [Catenaria anguillulae PL171]